MDPSPTELQIQGQHLMQRCVIIQRDEKGYGLTVTGDNPVYVQSVKDDGAAQRAGVQVGDRIIKVNGTVVTHLNHIEVVNLIKSGAYVALTLLGKPPVAPQEKPPLSPTPPITRDPCRDEKTMSIRRVLDQERHFYEKTREEYMKKPSEKLQKQLAESTTRIKAFDAELGALIGVENVKSPPLGGPLSAPPGRMAPPSTHLTRSASDSDSLWQQDNSFNENLPPPPPLRKYSNKTDQLPSYPRNKSKTLPGRIRNKQFICPEVPGHQRQHSSPDAFFRPEGEGGLIPASAREKKHSLEDMSKTQFGGLAPSSPSVIRRLLLDKRSPSLPSAWTPDGIERKTSNGTPPLPSVPSPPSDMEPVEKRGRSETTESYADDDSTSTSTEGTKPDRPVNMTIMSQEDDEFHSDEEKIDDHGPFNDLEILKNKPAHLSVFLHYLISNSDPSCLFFWLVTESYRDGNYKEMKKWSYEIYSTFLAEKAPLKIVVDGGIVQAIEATLGKDYSEESLRNLFLPARSACGQEVNEQLADFRNKRALGLGSLFGDHQLDDNMDKNKEISVVEMTLGPHLDILMNELESTPSPTPENIAQYDKTSAMASALTTFMRQTGMPVKAGSNYGNIIERCSSFTQKENKSIFKIKGSKKIKGHHFVSTHYSSTTFCNNCSNLLWGIGDQGYQCSICEYNVHKVGCLDNIEESCPGPKKRKQQKMNGLSTRRGNAPRRTPSAPNPDAIEQARHDRHVVSEVVHLVPTVNQTKKHGSLDDDAVSRRREKDDDAGSASEGEERSMSSPDELQVAAAVPKKRFTRPVIRSESVKTPKEMTRKKPIVSGGIMTRARKSVAGGDIFGRDVDINDSLSMNYGRGMDSPTSNLETLSEGERRARSRSPTFLPPEEEYDSDMEAEEQPAWQQTVDKKLLKKLKQKEIKRQEFIHELIYTEKYHVRNLKVLDKVFYKPMKKMNIIPYEAINRLFPNLQELIDIHVDLLQRMKKREGEGEVIQCIGDMMLERFDNEAGEAAKQACATFCNYQKTSLEHLRQRQRKDPKLAQFIMHCEGNSLCRRLKLDDIISTSYRRITKYPLLLEGISKNTPSSLPDSRDIERAIQCCKDLLAFVNQSVKECENQQRLEEFQRKVDRKQMDSSSKMEEYRNLDLTKKKLLYDGPLTWRISRTKSIDLHVLLLEDLLVILQKQDDRLILKCHSTNMSSYQTTHSPIIKLNNVLTRNVATDKRAFFLVGTAVGTSSMGPQIYELVAATITERKNWYKHITDAAEAFKGRERGRRGGVSLAGPRQNDGTGPTNPPLRQRRGALPPPGTELAPAPTSEDSDKKDEDEETPEEQEEAEEDKSSPVLPSPRIEDSRIPDLRIDEDLHQERGILEPPPEVRIIPKIDIHVKEPDDEQEPETEVEEPDREEQETETETEPDTAEELESECEPLPPPPPPPPPADDVDDLQLPNPPPDIRLPDPPPPITINVPPMYDRPCTIADLTNEESVDEKSPTRTSAFSESGWSSSSSSTETMKMRNGYGQGSGEDQDDTRSVSSNRSSLELLEQLRGKDEDLKRTLEDKARIIAELRGSSMTTGASSSESNVNGDPLEARDLILAAILQANRLTVAVSDVLSPGPGEEYSHSCSMTSLDRTESESVCSPQQQLVLSTSILNEQLTTLLGIITERDMARERLRCDLQLANTQIQRLKQGRSSSRRMRDSTNYLSHDDGYSGFRVDSPRPSSPTSSAADIDSDYAPLSEASTSDWLSEDNMDVNRSSSFSGYRNRSSFATSGYRSSTGSSSRHSRHRVPASRTYWSDDPDYESQF